MRHIVNHNEEARQGLHTYTMTMNKFGDMVNIHFLHSSVNLLS